MTSVLSKIDALVFEGGGLKGLAHVGALDVLQGQLGTTNIHAYAGTSAGSIVACLLAAGYSIPELKEFVWKMPTKSLKDGNLGFVRNLWRLVSNYGYYKGTFIEAYVENLLRKKLGKPNITFRELYDKTGNVLRITGTCLTTGELEYFDYNLSPTMPVSTAVRISTCVPLCFAAVSYKEKLYVDGGVLRNLPVMAFPDKTPLFFHFIESTEQPKIINLFTFVTSIVNIAINYCNKLAVQSRKPEFVIEIDTADINGMQFDVTEEQKQIIYDRGRAAGKLFTL